MQISPQTAYDNLQMLDRVDIAKGAIYRQLAQEVIADPEVSLTWRQAIADRLNQANNHLLATQSVSEDSY
jgi:hypothetical protein